MEKGPDKQKENNVKVMLHKLNLAFTTEKDEKKQTEQMHAIVRQATVEELDLLQKQIEDGVDVPPIFKESAEKKFMIELLNKQREIEKKNVAEKQKSLLERAKDEIEGAKKDIKEGDWTTVAKYAALTVGAGLAAKWVWDHTIGWLWNKTVGAGSSMLSWLAAAGGAFAGFMFARNGKMPDWLPTWVKAPVDAVTGAGKETADIVKELTGILKDLGIVWDGKGSVLEKILESGCVIIYDGGKFFINRMGRMISCPLECAKKMLAGESDMWVAYGTASVSYIVGRSMASAALKGRLGEMVPRMNWKTAGKLVFWPVSAGKDIFDIVKHVPFEAGRQAGMFKMSEHFLTRVFTQPNRTAMAQAITGSTTDYAQALKRWKYLREMRDAVEQGGHLKGYLSEADIKYLKKAEFELAHKLKEGAATLQPNGVAWAEKVRKGGTLVGIKKFEEVLSEVADDAINYAKEAKLTAPFLKGMEKPTARFSAVRQELEGLYQQRKTLPSTDPELIKVNEKITKLEAESKTLQRQMQGVLSQAEAALPEDAAKALRGKMAEKVLGRPLSVAEVDALHQIHLAGEDDFVKACKTHAPKVDPDLLRHASPKEIDAMSDLSQQAKHAINDAKNARLKAKIGKMDELHKAGKWGVGMDGAALKNERLLLFESGITGRTKPIAGGARVMQEGVMVPLGPARNVDVILREAKNAKSLRGAQLTETLQELQRTGKFPGLTDDVIHMVSNGGARAEKIAAGYLRTGDVADVTKLTNAFGRAARTSIPTGLLGIGGDGLGIWVAYNDLQENYRNIEEARKTGNSELRKLYESATIVNKAEIGIYSASAVLQFAGFFWAAAAGASVVAIPVTLVVGIGSMGYKEIQGHLEAWLREAKDWMKFPPETLMKCMMEHNDETLGRHISSLGNQAQYNNTTRYNLCKAYIALNTKVAKHPDEEADGAEGDKRFRQRESEFLEDQIGYISWATNRTYVIADPIVFEQARTHARLSASARQARALREQGITTPMTTTIKGKDGKERVIDLAEYGPINSSPDKDDYQDKRNRMMQISEDSTENMEGSMLTQLASLAQNPAEFARQAPQMIVGMMRDSISFIEGKILKWDDTFSGSARRWWNSDVAVSRGFIADQLKNGINAIITAVVQKKEVSVDAMTKHIANIRTMLRNTDPNSKLPPEAEGHRAYYESIGKDTQLLTPPGIAKLINDYPVIPPREAAESPDQATSIVALIAHATPVNAHSHVREFTIKANSQGVANVKNLEGWHYDVVNPNGSLQMLKNSMNFQHAVHKGTYLFWQPVHTPHSNKAELLLRVE